MSKIVESLVKSYAVLIMAERKKIEDIQEIYTVGGQDYNLRELVELEIAERTVSALV